MGLGTSAHEEIGPSVRSLRLADVAKRRGAATHGLYFLPQANDEDVAAVVLRVLDDREEPMQRFAMAILDQTPNAPSNDHDAPTPKG